MLILVSSNTQAGWGWSSLTSNQKIATGIALGAVTVGLVYWAYKALYKNAYGVCESQGHRTAMEDAHYEIIAKDHAFFGVFDGHSSSNIGKKIADYLVQNLYRNISLDTDFNRDLNQAITNGCKVTNYNLREDSTDGGNAFISGSTAIFSFIKGGKLYTGNVGDSRAVLVTATGELALSQDHKPGVVTEKTRIETEGFELGYYICSIPYIIIKDGAGRICRALAVSRAFGDFDAPCVIAEPQITMHDIVQEDQYLILACDGIWDVLSNNQAANIVRQSMTENNGDCKLAAQALVSAADAAGSRDNMTVIIVDLQRIKF